MKKISALDISKYLVEKANKVDENDLTNLKLQKLLYIIQVKYLEKYGKSLFTDPIEAWQFGPVVRDVYNTFKSCGAFPITLVDVNFSSQDIPVETKKFVDKIWDEYAKFSSGYLVNLTHKVNSPWAKAYRSDTKIIDQDLILSSSVKI